MFVLLKIFNTKWNQFCHPACKHQSTFNFEALDFSHCVKLRSVPELPASVTYIKAEGCNSLEPLPALLRQSSLSRPPSQSYDESSGGVAFTILNRYLQVLSLFAKWSITNIIYIYIYKTEAFEASTIFHVNTIFKK